MTVAQPTQLSGIGASQHQQHAGASGANNASGQLSDIDMQRRMARQQQQQPQWINGKFLL